VRAAASPARRATMTTRFPVGAASVTKPSACPCEDRKTHACSSRCHGSRALPSRGGRQLRKGVSNSAEPFVAQMIVAHSSNGCEFAHALRSCLPPRLEGLGEPVAICWSKRASSDFARASDGLSPLAAPTGKRRHCGRAPLGLRRRAHWRCSPQCRCSRTTRASGMMCKTSGIRLRRSGGARDRTDSPDWRRIRCGVALGRDVTLAELEASTTL